MSKNELYGEIIAWIFITIVGLFATISILTMVAICVFEGYYGGAVIILLGTMLITLDAFYPYRD
jgi:hypothetical protein